MPQPVPRGTGSPRHGPGPRAWRALNPGQVLGLPEGADGRLKGQQPAVYLCGLRLAGRPGGRPGCHRRAQGLQGAERVLDPGALFFARGAFAQRIQLLGQVVRTGLQVGPAGAAFPAAGTPGASAMRSPSASAWPFA